MSAIDLRTMVVSDERLEEIIRERSLGSEIYWWKFPSEMEVAQDYTIPVVKIYFAMRNGMLGPLGPNTLWFQYGILSVPHGEDQVITSVEAALDFFAKQRTALN